MYKKPYIDTLYVIPEGEKNERSLMAVIGQTRRDEKYTPTLQGYGIEEYDFSDTVIKHVKFVQCVFENCIFENVIFKDCEFEECCFEGDYFSFATLINCTFVNVAVWKSRFIRCMFNRVGVEYDDKFIEHSKTVDYYHINKYNKIVNCHLVFVTSSSSENVEADALTCAKNIFDKCSIKYKYGDNCMFTECRLVEI